MDILTNFCTALQTQDKSKRHSLLRNINVSDQVVQSIDDTVDSMSRSDLTLIIEPQKNSIIKKREETKIIYTANFIYVFKKNGIFHEIPGDLSTETKKEVKYHNESIIFTIDPQTNQIVSVYESMAGNTFGQANKNSRSIYIYALILLLALVSTAIFLTKN